MGPKCRLSLALLLATVLLIALQINNILGLGKQIAGK
jgi:hypothetical protein